MPSLGQKLNRSHIERDRRRQVESIIRGQSLWHETDNQLSNPENRGEISRKILFSGRLVKRRGNHRGHKKEDTKNMSEQEVTNQLSKTSLNEQEATEGEAGAEVNRDNREGLMKYLTKVLGADITAITLPVSVCEPTSFLMRLAEAVQYHDLLDKAAEAEDSSERLLWITVFALSIFVSNERAAKPFNPILGETYEFSQPSNKNYRFFAEQVSHHPPIGACIAENDEWKFWSSQCLKTKFTGNSLECNGTGFSNVLIKKTGEVFQWEPVKTVVHNLIIGKLWVDNFGDLSVINKNTGEKANINLKQCGWFSKGWRELEGDVLAKDGSVNFRVTGKWTESIFAEDKKGGKKKFQFYKNATDPLWVPTNKPLPPNKVPSIYARDFTDYTIELIQYDSTMTHLPPTDSRLRPDRLALEKGDTTVAGREKHNLEEKQREARRKREREGVTYVPKYFQTVKENGQDSWEYVGKYWEEREARKQ
ncbi:putative oxysterol binding protein (Osh1) [Planoprotostelium fungivorum]|uniref:Putative oxysterol binding protein (Osh1) n=1 Tax=Planoprotostelium fungivorum TaxID=1890364 RepID=A0A2P6NNA6_9EUKA|nr:putative oxysterol binding protein (Osh1) [Planoprotostelium fungivorum]